MKKTAMAPHRQKEKGITLVVALIMLVLLTLLVVSSMNLGKGSLEAVGNMQHRTETINAAQETIEEVLSNTNFFETPNAVFTTPCNGDLNTKCVDVNGDGTTDVTVQLTPPPSMLKAQTLKTTDLDYAQPEDLGCVVSQQQTYGVGMPGAAAGNSLCADSGWEIHAVATDTTTETKVVATQGVSVRVSTTDLDAAAAR